jgi:hypothetical protein
VGRIGGAAYGWYARAAMRKRAARLAVGTLLLVAAAVPSTAAAQEITFAPLTLYQHGDDVSGDRLATGDLNGDGRSDVLVADAAAPRVTVRLAQPDGTLGAPVVHAFDATRGLALVDVNGDGDLDLLLSGQDALRVALGGAGGSFGDPTNVGAGGFDVVADFNGDGDPDLAFFDSPGVNVVVRLGGPGGSFGSPTSYLVGDPGTLNSTTLISADFNGDGAPDLVAALPNRVVVLIGGGGGSFSESARFAAESFPVTVGDFNGDGDPDLVTTPSSGVARVRVGLAGSGFGAPTDYESVFLARALFARDLDQDGDDELIEWAPSGNEAAPSAMLVRPGDPSGQLGAAEQTAIPELVGLPLFADFNQDGDPDLAVVNTIAIGDPPTVQILIMAGADGTTFTFGPATFVGAVGFPGPLDAGDFNGDDKTDLVVLATIIAVEGQPFDGPAIGIWLNATSDDRTPPKIIIRVPSHGAKYRLGQTVLADYECFDPESEVTLCSGSVADGDPIDTASVGHKTFHVLAESSGGSTVRKRHYRVVLPLH